MKRDLSFSGLVLVISMQAHAANWFTVFELGEAGRNAFSVEVDLDSVTGRDASRQANIRLNHTTPKTHPSGVAYRSVESVLQIDCVNRTVAHSAATYYSQLFARGNVVFTERGDQPQARHNLLDYIPEKASDALMRAACASNR